MCAAHVFFARVVTEGFVCGGSCAAYVHGATICSLWVPDRGKLHVCTKHMCHTHIQEVPDPAYILHSSCSLHTCGAYRCTCAACTWNLYFSVRAVIYIPVHVDTHPYSTI